MADEDSIPEDSADPGLIAELGRDIEAAQEHVLPVVNELSRFLASQRAARAEMERALESQRELVADMERSAEAGRQMRAALEHSAEAARQLRADIEAAERSDSDIRRAARTADEEVRRTLNALAKDTYERLNGFKIELIARGSVGSAIGAVSGFLGAAEVREVHGVFASVRIPKVSVAGTGIVSSGVVAHARIAEAAASAPAADVSVVHVSDSDHLRLTEISGEVEKVTDEVNRHGIAGLSPAQLVIVIGLVLLIGVGVGENAGYISPTEVGKYEPLAAYAALLVAVVLALERRNK